MEKVHADRLGAHVHLEQAEKFQRDANADLAAESQSVLLHTAAISACSAILQAVGLRVTSGDGAHILRLEVALEQLPQDTDDLFDRLDASRSRRNEASYAAMLVAEASVEEAREGTAELIELTRDFLHE